MSPESSAPGRDAPASPPATPPPGPGESVSDFEQAFGPEMASKLLRAEYPADMAQASCSCEPQAVCGAHRLLIRYEELYAHLRAMHAERRQARAVHTGGDAR